MRPVHDPPPTTSDLDDITALHDCATGITLSYLYISGPTFI
jgi:hypothetical protein